MSDWASALEAAQLTSELVLDQMLGELDRAVRHDNVTRCNRELLAFLDSIGKTSGG